MKKKTLFSLALASILMVGCQQDEFVTVNDATSVNLGNRPELGSVSLNWGDPTTRLALNTVNNYSFKWEEGDKLGAAIVDTPAETAQSGKDLTSKGGKNYSSYSWTYAEYVAGVKKGPTGAEVIAEEAGVDIEAYYTISTQSYISSNYPYLLEGTAWNTQANLVEGNYVFYAPYNAAHLTRQPIVVTLPMEQDCAEESKSVTDFYAGTDPVTLGFDFLKAPANKDELISPSVKMTNIFAYPQITIKNNFNGYLFNGDAAVSTKFYSSAAAAEYTMKLQKIEIYTKATGDLLDYKRALDVDAFKTKIAGGWDADKKEDGTKIFTTGVTKDILSATGAYNVSDYPAYPANAAKAKEAGYATQYAVGSNDLISAYEVKHITCDLGGKELKNGEEYKFFAIMPAEDYSNDLFAKVYVEIDGENYIILTSSADLNVETATGAYKNLAYFTDATTVLADYNFRDEKHGDQGVRLVRCQRFPAAEVLEDASAVKDFAGSLMTINLVGGKKQAAYAIAKEIPTDHKGITDNADFIEHITKKVQRGVSLVENSAVETTDRDEWDAADIAFAPENTVIINAELIKALYNRLYDQRPGATATGDVLELTTTQLPIANDVFVEATSDTYTFTTLDGVSYQIKYATALVGTDGTQLINGINTVAAGGTLALKDKNVTGAVVMITGGSATLAKADGIAAINIASAGALTVNCSTNALISNAGSITIGAEGTLTNTNNVLKGTIDNSALRSIAGDVSEATVSASVIGWPKSVISADTKINALAINLGTDGVLTINQTEVGKLANLKKVQVTLGDEVSGIQSSANVTLTNIAKMTGKTAGVAWNTTEGAITITCGAEVATFFTNITAGIGVTFVK